MWSLPIVLFRWMRWSTHSNSQFQQSSPNENFRAPIESSGPWSTISIISVSSSCRPLRNSRNYRKRKRWVPCANHAFPRQLRAIRTVFIVGYYEAENDLREEVSVSSTKFAILSQVPGKSTCGDQMRNSGHHVGDGPAKLCKDTKQASIH
jgi:hypothetical protein